MTHEEFESVAALDALGIANFGELAAMRLHLAACHPCRAAHAEFARTTSMFALALAPIPPPPYVRERVMSEVMPDTAAVANRWWLVTAATLFLGLWGWRELDLRASREREGVQRTVIARLQQQNGRLNAEIAALASADTRTIALSGQEIAPAASAKVFLEPDRRRAIVFFHDLPANPGDKSYQLWIIRADQPEPMSAGVFDVTESGKASIVIENLPVSTEMKALAVTLEPKGGAPRPTNTKFYVAGDT
ncbi:MAG TPA: anti-sigma factor [Thermoanaerobaculia bacterium]|nr:anti-sigma factor [Thermoanaerobaculia bacterium]